MARAKKEYIKTEIIVSGKGRFPVDMLRYDLCVPANADAMHNMHTEYIHTPCEVKLYRFSGDGGPCTSGRWASFGWVVVHDTGRAE